MSLLFWLVVLPIVGGGIALFTPARGARWVALVTSLIGFVLSIALYFAFDAGLAAEMQIKWAIPWVNSLKIHFALGVDGLSLPLVLLTKLMVPIALLASWGETRRVSLFMASFLILDSAMTGTFLATDIFLFYVFWEVMLVPMILIIGIWGSAQRIYAAVKFFLFTFAGSLLMLVAILWLFTAHWQQYGVPSAEIASFYKLTFAANPLFLGLNAQELIFLAFTIAFAIKVPLFPLHTWLPDAHVQAPTGGSILLAAVMLKMGTYGLLRFSIPIAPLAFERFTPLLAALSLIAILYGAWVAFQQTDMKKLVAYSSVSHMGFVVLGLCASNGEAWTGAMLQMINHGLSTGALFFLVGALYERRHSRNFSDFGGLAEFVPWFAVLLVFVACSSMAVPGLNGFVGEFLILWGSYQHNPVWAGIAVLGVIFGAAYTLLMVRQVLFGPTHSAENRLLKDLTPREWCGLIPLVILIIALGIKPGFVTKTFEASLAGIKTVKSGGKS